MRSLKIVVVMAIVATVMWPALANGGEPVLKPPKRVTASAFAEAGFPPAIVQVVRMGDHIWRLTSLDKIRAKQRLDHVEETFDRILFSTNASYELLEDVQKRYNDTRQAYWSVEREIRAADRKVIELYETWSYEAIDEKAAKVFQEWKASIEANYINVSSEEKEVYRMMFWLSDNAIARLKNWPQRRIDAPIFWKISERRIP